RDTNVIVQALAHAALAVEPAQDRQRQTNLRLLTGVPLQIATDHQAEKLFATAQLDVGVDRHAVLTLHERVETFMQIDRRAGLATLGEVIALQHALHGDFPREVEDVEEREAAEPVPVVPDFRLGDIDHLADLLEVVARVGFHLLGRQPGAGLIAAAGVADQRRVIADNQDRLMAKFLKDPQLPQRYRVAEVNV